MDKSHTRFGKLGKAAGVAGFAIAGGLAVGLTKSVHAAMAAEESQGRLEVAFKNSGIQASRYTKQIAAQLKAGRALGFSNSDQRQALGSLIVATHSYRKASQDLTVAQDIARFKNVDLTSATKMLTMAQAGSQRATKQLGLTVAASTDNADKAKLAYRAQKDALDEQFPSMAKMTAAQKEQFYAARDAIDQQYAGAKAVAQLTDKQVTAAKVIELVRQKLHGQAEEFSETAAGRIQIFQAQISNLEGTLGKALLPAIIAVTEKLTALITFFSEHERITKLLIVALTALSAALITVSVATKIAAAATKLWSAATKIATAAQWALNVAVEANPYVAAATAIAILVAALVVLQVRYNAVTNAVRFLREHLYLLIAVPVLGQFALLAVAIDKLIQHWNGLVSAMQPAINAVHGINSAIQRLVHWLKEAVDLVTSLIGALGKIHVPHISIPHIGVPGIGDGGGGGAGEGSAFHVGRQLWDEIGMGEQVGLRVTSGYRPGAVTTHGTKSDHSYNPSRAVDMSGSPYGMAALFNALIGRGEIRQAFYDPLGSIFNGIRSSYREGGHSDHIHIAEYDKGGYLRPGWNLSYNGLGRPEAVGGDVIIPVSIGDEHIATVVWDQLRRKAKVFENRNGRAAFGGA